MSSDRSGGCNPVGSHIKVAGGLATGGLRYAAGVGAEVVQVFTGNPRGWAAAAGDPRQDARFRDGCAERAVPVFVHAPYLVNLGSPNPQTLDRSVETVRHTLRRAAAIGAAGVVVHAGSATLAAADRGPAFARLRERLLPILDECGDGEFAGQGGGRPRLLVEPAAGGGLALADTVPALAGYLDALDRHPGLGVCLDTCHLWAAGHDIGSPAGMRAMLDTYLESIGHGRLGLVHANDSRDGCGSRRDRHESVGSGRIGAEPFAVLFQHPATRGTPLVVETADTAHATDIATLKRLRDGSDRHRLAANGTIVTNW